jgi:Holliday junction resolvasome RuvABC endonuclease subunit
MTAVTGWDISLAATGVRLPDGHTFTIHTTDRLTRGERLHELRLAARHYLRRGHVDLAVIEKVPPMVRQVDTAVALGMAQGVIRELLAEFRVPVADVVNSTLKRFATGRGDADKGQVVAAANRHRLARHRRVGAGMLLDITDDNEADAWWLGEMGLWWSGARHLDESADAFIGGAALRDRCVHGPWPGHGQGAKWPGDRAGARRRAHAAPPGHPPAG